MLKVVWKVSWNLLIDNKGVLVYNEHMRCELCQSPDLHHTFVVEGKRVCTRCFLSLKHLAVA